MSGPAPAHRAVAALTAFELRLAARRGENLLVTFLIPAAVLVFLATVSVLPADARSVDSLLPGALALGIIAAGFVSLGIATAYERGYGVLKRLGGAPLPRGALVVAKILAVLAIELAQSALLVAVAVAVLGWRPSGPVSVPLALLAVALGTAAFAGLGLAMAGALRAEATLAVANGVFVGLLLAGGVVVPLDGLPAPVAAVASFLPAAPLAELLRVAFAAEAANPAPAAVLLAAWAVAGIALAARWFRWE